jgi:cation transport ATPase
MNPFEMVVMIVLIVTIGRVFGARIGRRRDKAQGIMGMMQDDPENVRQREEIKALKERIAVLERLATDNNSAIALDREIEKLR